MGVIKQVIRLGNEQAMLQTANKIKAVTGISSPLGNREFLQTVISDYQFVTAQ